MMRERFGLAGRLRQDTVRRFAEVLSTDPAARLPRPDPAFRAALRSRLVATAATAAARSRR